MKKLLATALMALVTQCSITQATYYNLKRFISYNSKAKKACLENPRAFFKGEVEQACDSLNDSLNIIRETYEFLELFKEPNNEERDKKKNAFLASLTDPKNLNAAKIAAAISIVLPNESPEICEKESNNFIFDRLDHINKLLNERPEIRHQAWLKYLNEEIAELNIKSTIAQKQADDFNRLNRDFQNLSRPIRKEK